MFVIIWGGFQLKGYNRFENGFVEDVIVVWYDVGEGFVKLYMFVFKYDLDKVFKVLLILVVEDLILINILIVI